MHVCGQYEQVGRWWWRGTQEQGKGSGVWVLPTVVAPHQAACTAKPQRAGFHVLARYEGACMFDPHRSQWNQ